MSALRRKEMESLLDGLNTQSSISSAEQTQKQQPTDGPNQPSTSGPQHKRCLISQDKDDPTNFKYQLNQIKCVEKSIGNKATKKHFSSSQREKTVDASDSDEEFEDTLRNCRVPLLRRKVRTQDKSKNMNTLDNRVKHDYLSALRLRDVCEISDSEDENQTSGSTNRF